ncbi:hypothetical protein AVEN_68931-1 [Araneus ventricosus]|uniref:Uncharacterized protein n=1 Tax=Araneus ventricosus TaxID=182803 RepID=A0A4Y2HJ07_ARAVE|nr:hypothetical protein AVEN_68931-1 [Araneus ventricosus]
MKFKSSFQPNLGSFSPLFSLRSRHTTRPPSRRKAPSPFTSLPLGKEDSLSKTAQNPRLGSSGTASSEHSRQDGTVLLLPSWRLFVAGQEKLKIHLIEKLNICN